MTQKYWNDKFMIKGHFGFGPTGFAIECAEFLKNYPKQKKLLDLGCGQGRDSVYFSSLSYDVTALDYSSQALLSLSQQTILSDIRDINQYFKSNSLDVIYSNEVLHFLTKEDAMKLINRILIILKPCGFFIFTCKNNDDKHFGKGEQVANATFIFKGVIRHFFSEESLKESLNTFKIHRFERGSHVMFGEAPSVYWKVIAQKK